MIILEFIPVVITPSSSPIADAAIIKLNLEEIKNPPDRAFFVPNNLFTHNLRCFCLIVTDLIECIKRNRMAIVVEITPISMMV